MCVRAHVRVQASVRECLCVCIYVCVCLCVGISVLVPLSGVIQSRGFRQQKKERKKERKILFQQMDSIL